MKIEKLRKNFQFRIVYGRGKSFSNRLLVLYILRNNLKVNRLGISVSKKVGKSVIRSRVKRLISESYRLNSGRLTAGYDLIFVARVLSKSKSYKEIEDALINILLKAGLFIDEKNTDKLD